MDEQINNIIKKYQFDRSTRYYSNKHYLKNNIIHREIKSKCDVERYETSVFNYLNILIKAKYRLVNDDIDEAEKAIGRYEIAVHKVLQCYGQFDFDYTSEELQQLINNIFKCYDLLDDIKMRKACQD